MKVAYTTDENCEWYVLHEVKETGGLLWEKSKPHKLFSKGIIEFGVEAIREATGKDQMITVNIFDIDPSEVWEAKDYASDKQPFVR